MSDVVGEGGEAREGGHPTREQSHQHFHLGRCIFICIA